MSDEELAKDLGLVSAMTIGIGTMIGAGIFVLPGVAANAAGPLPFTHSQNVERQRGVPREWETRRRHGR